MRMLEHPRYARRDQASRGNRVDSRVMLKMLEVLEHDRGCSSMTEQNQGSAELRRVMLEVLEHDQASTAQTAVTPSYARSCSVPLA